MDPTFHHEAEVIPEHFLAALYGFGALALGAAVWSAMAVLGGAWTLPVMPAMGWLTGWACLHGGRRPDSFIRATAFLLSLAGALIALFLFCAFSVTQTSPDSGFQSRTVGLEYLRLFTEPPWFGSVTVVLALAGTWRALRDRGRRRGAPAGAQVRERASVRMDSRPAASQAAATDRGSRAA